MKIVAVDDEDFCLKLLVRQLAGMGLTDVIPCRSGRDALDALDAHHDAIDLLIFDLQMPEMDGVQLVRAIAATRFTGSVALVSGEDTRILQTSARLARAHGLNVVGAFQKPVAPEQLADLLERHRSRGPVRPRPCATTYGADRLRAAIANGELVNYYQPKIDLRSGAVLGVEALVRWRHPLDGMVFPDSFIGTAESNGLIDDLTRVVLCAALRQVRAWSDAGLTLSVAVNVSLDNLADLRFPDFVHEAVRDAGVPFSQLELEVTESRLALDARAPLDVLARLRLKRVTLSIDDFGTGHSSLAQLRDYPFDGLKIDRGFVHGAARDPSLRAIFDASLRMARDLDMKTVAEGVEDRADWDLLRSSTCGMAQGYFIAKPMPGVDLPGWVPGWEARRKELFRTPQAPDAGAPAAARPSAD